MLLNTRYHVQILKNYQILRQSAFSDNFEFEMSECVKSKNSYTFVKD